MLRSIARFPLRAHLSRSYSRTLPTAASSPQVQEPISMRYPYAVSRNTRGSLPVYTDIRNHNRYLTLIRNVEGNVDVSFHFLLPSLSLPPSDFIHLPILLFQALVNDISTSLFPPGSPQAERMQVQTVRSRHIVLNGGKWKNEVVEWLRARGF